MHFFNQKSKLDLGEIYFVLNFQGCARFATGVGCKCLNNKKVKTFTEKYISLYIYLNNLKKAISLEPTCFSEKGFLAR